MHIPFHFLINAASSKSGTSQSYLSSLLRSVLPPFSCSSFPFPGGLGQASARLLLCLLFFGLFRWGGGAEVWFFNTPALLFCCWPPQTTVKFWFQHSWEPFPFWLSHWFFDRQHFVLSFPTPGQSHHGFFWNVRQSYHCSSSLITHPWSLSFCHCTVKSHTLFKLLSHSRYYMLCNRSWCEHSQVTCSAIEITENTEIRHSVYF